MGASCDELTLIGQKCVLTSLSQKAFRALVEKGSYCGLQSFGKWPTEPMLSIIKKDLKDYKHFPELMIWSAWVISDALGTIVGDIGFKGPPDFGGRVEIGYQILKDHQNQGFATESVMLMCNFAFSKGVDVIEAEVLKTNGPSLKVIDKCGFSFVRATEKYVYFEKKEK